MGDNMKIEKNIIISLLILLGIVVLFIFSRNYLKYKNIYHVASNPFNTIEIVGKKVRLKDNLRTYDLEVDCSELSEHEQITYYRLNEDYKDFKISVATKVFKNNKLLEKDLNEATSLEVNISVQDKDETYEQIYKINATCLVDEDSELE